MDTAICIQKRAFFEAVLDAKDRIRRTPFYSMISMLDFQQSKLHHCDSKLNVEHRFSQERIVKFTSMSKLTLSVIA